MPAVQRHTEDLGPTDPVPGSATDGAGGERRSRSVPASRPGGFNVVVLLAIIAVMVLAAAALIDGPRIGVDDTVPAQAGQPQTS